MAKKMINPTNVAYIKYAPITKQRIDRTFITKLFCFSTNTYTSNISLPPNLPWHYSTKL